MSEENCLINCRGIGKNDYKVKLKSNIIAYHALESTLHFEYGQQANAGIIN